MFPYGNLPKRPLFSVVKGVGWQGKVETAVQILAA
jgi:hypothetical protein